MPFRIPWASNEKSKFKEKAFFELWSSGWGILENLSCFLRAVWGACCWGRFCRRVLLGFWRADNWTSLKLRCCTFRGEFGEDFFVLVFVISWCWRGWIRLFLMLLETFMFSLQFCDVAWGRGVNPKPVDRKNYNSNLQLFYIYNSSLKYL